MAEAIVEQLSERERAGLDHLRQARSLGISFATYCRRGNLDLNLWYRVKQKLARKGLTVPIEGSRVAEAVRVDPIGKQKQARFTRVRVAAAPVPPAAATAAVACRIVHPSGWILECGIFPQASWLAAVLAGQRL